MALPLEICISANSFIINQPVSIVQPHKLPDSKLHDTSAILRHSVREKLEASRYGQCFSAFVDILAGVR